MPDVTQDGIIAASLTRTVGAAGDVINHHRLAGSQSGPTHQLEPVFCTASIARFPARAVVPAGPAASDTQLTGDHRNTPHAFETRGMHGGVATAGVVRSTAPGLADDGQGTAAFGLDLVDPLSSDLGVGSLLQDTRWAGGFGVCTRRAALAQVASWSESGVSSCLSARAVMVSVMHLLG